MGGVQVSREQHVRFAGDKRLHRLPTGPGRMENNGVEVGLQSICDRRYAAVEYALNAPFPAPEEVTQHVYA